MVQLKGQELLNEVCRSLIMEENADGIEKAIELAGRGYGLDGVALATMGDCPLMFELSAIWQAEPTQDLNRILDFRDSEYMSPSNPKGRQFETFAISDVSLLKDIEGAADLFGLFDMKAAVVASIVRNLDFLGFIIFYKKEIFNWTEEEKDTFTKFADCLYTTVLRQNKYRMQHFLVEESFDYVKGVNQSKSQFVTNLVHEVRTPVNAITGILSIMRHNMDNKEVLEQCMERMEKSSGQLLDLVGRCVETTVVEDEGILLNKSWFRIGEMVDILKRTLGPLIKFRHQEIVFNCEPRVSINADQARMLKIFTCLIENSCKYSPIGGKINFDVEIESISETRKKIFMFRISDNGMGMNASTVKHLFDSMLDNNPHVSDNNTGIGLMIVRHYVDMMHGSLDVSSEEGIGTEIVVSLELESDANTEKQIIMPSANKHEEVSELYIGRRILIAEDNVLMAEILATVLGFKGLESDTAVNGKEAYEKFCDHDPFYYDMIFMDISMPVMDGLEATKAIRESGTADADIIPIVALSSNTFAENERKSIAAGMNAHLGKPVAEQELFDTIEKFMI